MKTKSLSSLPVGLFAAYYRSQPDIVRERLRKVLGLFPDPTLNLSKGLVPQENKPLIT